MSYFKDRLFFITQCQNYDWMINHCPNNDLIWNNHPCHPSSSCNVSYRLFILDHLAWTLKSKKNVQKSALYTQSRSKANMFISQLSASENVPKKLKLWKHTFPASKFWRWYLAINEECTLGWGFESKVSQIMLAKKYVLFVIITKIYAL